MINDNSQSKSFKSTPFPPIGLNRSGVACWWSILNLIQQSSKEGIPCYLWTLTFKKTYPDSWCGNMHRNLIRHLVADSKAGRTGAKAFAGVRVTEVHPDGHGIHFHWVIKGKLSLGCVRKRAKQCGFGHVFIARDGSNRFRQIDVGAAGYLCKYLTKGDRLAGIRSWSCIGDYDGVKTKDIEFDSPDSRVFRQAYAASKLAGSPQSLCFQSAVLAQRKYNHEADSRECITSIRGLEERAKEIRQANVGRERREVQLEIGQPLIHIKDKGI